MSSSNARSGISVCLATYNGARFLEKQLASLEEQTLAPDELIISDDCSTDGTFALLRSFAERTHLRVRLQRNPKRLGYGRNFSICASMAREQLIAFCDQDDVWEPDKLAVLAKAAAGSPALAFSHDLTLVDGQGVETDQSGYFGILADRGFAPEICCKGCALAFRRSFLEQFGMPPPKPGLSHDFWVSFISTALGKRHILPERLVRHRLHGANTSGWLVDRSDMAPQAPSFPEARDVPIAVSQMINVYLNERSLSWVQPLLRILSVPASQKSYSHLIPILHLIVENHNWYADQRARSN
jgi:glycosyltransferase involved in cell wall biosynthesis